MLELKNISKKFKDRQILSDFNLTVEENKILAIVGPSGGGKTTLLRMLAGLEKIDSGEIIYNSESLPIDELEKRLINRDTDSEDTIKMRVNKAQQELEYKNHFDKVLVNDDLDKAKHEIEKLVQNFIQ